MIIVLFLVAGVVVLLVALPLILRSAMRQVEETDAELHTPAAETLCYAIPNGQDPVVVMTALHHAGYPAVSDPVDGDQRLLIGCPGGRKSERAGVRAVIEHAHTTGIEGADLRVEHVRFEDEG
ncbi:MAG TPA: hypothetical protein VLI04_20615 [Nocardioidaceae bacterium]|nr:hypothetical protein [Nocardioidaceae bacterium]